MPNDDNELIPNRTIVGYCMCVDYRKLNKETRKEHHPLPFIDEMLERLAKNSHYYYLDGYSRFPQIAVHPEDQEKTTLPVYLVCMLIDECLSDYVMHQPCFRNTCLLFLLIFLNKLWNY